MTKMLYKYSVIWHVKLQKTAVISTAHIYVNNYLMTKILNPIPSKT